MPRQGRIDYPGALHHIIGRGIERRAIFKEAADKSLFLKKIKEQISKSDVQEYNGQPFPRSGGRKTGKCMMNGYWVTGILLIEYITKSMMEFIIKQKILTS